MFDASRVCGVELVPQLIEALDVKYSSNTRVKILEQDITDPNLAFDTKFDLVNAIGVMFHITNDNDWEWALRNICDSINQGGVVIVGGQFGLISRDIGFANKDEFSSLEEMGAQNETNQVLVTKRIRSLGRWRKMAQNLGLEVHALIKSDKPKYMSAPENNVLILRKP